MSFFFEILVMQKFKCPNLSKNQNSIKTKKNQNSIKTKNQNSKNTQMLFPICCFSCNMRVGKKWLSYKKLLNDGMSQKEALDKLEIKRYCCRRMFLTFLDKASSINLYEQTFGEKDTQHISEKKIYSKNRTYRAI